jgi:hypothetical protein
MLCFPGRWGKPISLQSKEIRVVCAEQFEKPPDEQRYRGCANHWQCFGVTKAAAILVMEVAVGLMRCATSETRLKPSH